MSILNANADACPSVIPDADSDGSAQASFVASEFPARIQPTFHAFPFKSISSVKSTFLGRTTSSATRWPLEAAPADGPAIDTTVGIGKDCAGPEGSGIAAGPTVEDIVGGPVNGTGAIEGTGTMTGGASGGTGATETGGIGTIEGAGTTTTGGTSDGAGIATGAGAGAGAADETGTIEGAGITAIGGASDGAGAAKGVDGTTSGVE
ncbi:transferase family protein [Penicillium atrosanguineum]|uniref:transferase family protein n=1 Tax=Penicillium atrosanguineum TaxID=1132637 RepID=UPI0023A2B439|nr:transferase family protein [Penicillium atrosanguineum]KAJ5310361.1 transferase family protein [Penicillium atrosanguineum]